ncbi:MAG: hypothetical protein ACJAZO_005416 [Myxococcota bacterium]|jgi:hypothetical protein
MRLFGPEDAAFQQLISAPLRVVIVGGTSVGKTTLANAWTSGDAPTGLGGQTHEVRETRHQDRLIIDTPSLDEGFDIFPVAHGCDVLVWVVDGLRPISQTEATRIHAVRPLVGDCVAIVSRADLLPTTEYTQVMQRCAQLFEGPVAPADLRRTPPMFPPIDPLRTRRRVLQSFLAACLAPLDRAEALVDEWRMLCRTAAPAQADSDVGRFELSLNTACSTLGIRPPPPLPRPAFHLHTTPASSPPMGNVKPASLAAYRAQWCMDGDLILTGWLAPLGSMLERRERRNALSQVQNRVRTLPATPLA